MNRGRAIVLAVAISGGPSTIAALLRRGDLLASTRAAGTLVPGSFESPFLSVMAGAAAHVTIATFWGAVLWRVLPRRRAALWGGAAGLVIAALDLGVAARRFPAVRALPRGPQIADHVAFGVVVGVCRALVHDPRNPAGTLAHL